VENMVIQENIDRVNSKKESKKDYFITIGTWEIEKYNWDSNDEKIKHILQLVKNIFKNMFTPEYIDNKKVIFINKGTVDKNPECLQEEKIISLQIDVFNYEQVVYQAAHELCHFMMYDHDGVGGYDQLPTIFHWFEEVICEFASWFVIKTIASMGLGISDNFARYQKNIETKYIDFDTAKLYNEKSDYLKKNSCDRDINNKFIQGIIKKNDYEEKEFWLVLTYIHKIKYEEIDSFDDLFSKWFKYCSEKENKIVINMSLLFGLTIRQ
jgi:hypothetical protein